MAHTHLKVVPPSYAGERTLAPTTFSVVKGEGREMAAAKFEELARQIRAGELDGGSCEWRIAKFLERSPSGKAMTRLVYTLVTPVKVARFEQRIEETGDGK